MTLVERGVARDVTARRAAERGLDDADEGLGSTFTLRLPEHRDPADPEPTSPQDDETPVDAYRGDETILLAEDDANLRTVVARMLERFGYRVVLAANGLEAFEVMQAGTPFIDLLLTDVVMPELDGPELVERLTSCGLTCRVVYMSGYSDQAVLRRVTLSPTTQLLRKPFTLDALLRTVRSTLDQ
jgi:CheY-like chemotaxis protein